MEKQARVCVCALRLFLRLDEGDSVAPVLVEAADAPAEAPPVVRHAQMGSRKNERKDFLDVLEAPIRQASLAEIRGGQHAFGRSPPQQLTRGRVHGARSKHAHEFDELVLREGQGLKGWSLACSSLHRPSARFIGTGKSALSTSIGLASPKFDGRAPACSTVTWASGTPASSRVPAARPPHESETTLEGSATTLVVVSPTDVT